MDKRKYFIGGALLFVLLVVLFFGLQVYNAKTRVRQLEKAAHTFMEQGEYQKAVEKYKELSQGTDDPEYQKKMTEAMTLEQSRKSFEVAQEQMRAQEPLKAVLIMNGIKKEDQVYMPQAKELLETNKTRILSAYEKMLSSGKDEETAMEVKEICDRIAGMGALFDEREQKVADKVQQEKDQKEKQEQEEREKQKQAEEEQKKQQDQNNQATGWVGRESVYGSGLIGQTLYTTAERSNLRQKPSLDSKIITYVSAGASVYITDVVPGQGRNWYRGIITSRVTGNTYDAWISSNNFK